MSAIVRNVVFLHLIACFQLQLVWRALDTWQKKNVFEVHGGAIGVKL